MAFTIIPRRVRGSLYFDVVDVFAPAFALAHNAWSFAEDHARNVASLSGGGR